MNCFPSGLDNGGFEPVHQNLAYVSADEIESLRVKYHKYNLKFLHGDYVREDVLLRETEIFRGLTGEQIGKILRISRKVTFSEDEIIMREGEEGDAMYIIPEGTVEVVKSLVKGDPVEKSR